MTMHRPTLIASLLPLVLLGALSGCRGDAGAPVLESTTAAAVAIDGDDPTVVAADAVSTPARGARSPLVVVTVFEDLQCPYCRSVDPLIERLVEAWPDEVQVQFRHLPLGFHERARTAAHATMAAHRQGRFWPYTRLLFAEQAAWSRGADDTDFKQQLLGYAERLKLDLARFQQDMADPRVADKVSQDFAKAQELQVRGTPTIAVNGRVIQHRRRVDETLRVIDEEIRIGQKLVRDGLPRASVATVRAKANARNPQSVAWLVEDRDVDAARVKQANAAGAASRRPDVTEEVWAATVRADDPVKGGKDTALVTLVVFSEFQCPFCARINPTIEGLLAKYGDDLRVVFKHLPLPFHKEARPAAEASLCAHEQGQFWAFHDKLFANQRALGPDDLAEAARAVGLDMAKYDECLRSGRTRARVDEDMALAEEVGARGTPNVFINGRKSTGAKPQADLEAIIDVELDKARPMAAEHGRGDGLYAVLMNRAKRQTALAEDIVTLDLAGAPRLGREDAPVKFTVFSDFECPFCGRVGGPLHKLVEHRPNDVAVYFKHFPLSFHKRAEPAARAAVCAQAQGRFWPFHDRLFANQQALTDADLLAHAKAAGVDQAAFTACLSAPETAARVRADFEEGSRVGVDGTPTLFVNGRKYDASLGYDGPGLSRLVDKLVPR